MAADVKVILSGLATGDKVMLSIASGSYLATIQATENGTFTFVNVPEGKHSVKAEATGYNVMEALTVEVKNNSVVPSQPLKIAVTKMSENPDSWNFEWKEDGSPSGYTTTAHKNEPAEIEFLGKMIVPADVPSFSILKEKYNIVLANDEKPWSQEYAYRMVETMKTIPTCWEKPAKISLTAEHLADDISVVNVEGGCEVRISEDAFYYANPFLVNLDGKRGRLFSKRLHHALVNFITDFGREDWKVDFILTQRFGCSISGINYTELTQATTQENAACFQQFKPAELVSIINMFEEFPEGFRKVPHLKYLIRRQNGHDHPLYPEAAAGHGLRLRTATLSLWKKHLEETVRNWLPKDLSCMRRRTSFGNTYSRKKSKQNGLSWVDGIKIPISQVGGQQRKLRSSCRHTHMRKILTKTWRSR